MNLIVWMFVRVWEDGERGKDRPGSKWSWMAVGTHRGWEMEEDDQLGRR